MDTYIALLSLIVFLPAIGALALAFVPRNNSEVIRYITLVVTALVFVLTVYVFFSDYSGAKFEKSGEAAAYMQDVFNWSWIPSFNIYYFMGIDGISLPLVVLTAFVSLLAMGASWSITKQVKAYCILFLLLETGMLGVFLALDFFLFYIFWEVMLLPMYFLIGVWGGPRREYAAIKFFLFTLVGSVLMLIAILMLYFASDLREVAKVSDLYGDQSAAVEWDRLHIHPKLADRLRGAKTVFRVPEGIEESLAESLDKARSRASEEMGSQNLDKAEAALRRVLELEAKQAEARTAILSAGGQHHLELLRGSSFQQVDVAFEPADSGVGETRAEYDASRQAVTVMLVAGQTTVKHVVDAINAIEMPPRGEAVLTARVAENGDESVEVSSDDGATIENLEGKENKVNTFNLLALAACGQHTEVFSQSLQVWAFALLFVGFAIKVPSVPVHTWLPDAHVEAPTPISMILAGVLLKMGGYGIIRICYPICPHGGYDWSWWVCGIGVVSMVYGAYAALAQKDFKRLVAYSSVSHMGYVVLGLGVWSATSATAYNSDYWNMGVQGAMFQMIAHGVSSAGMFFIVGVVYDRVHHRNLNEFGGLFGKMPMYTAFAIALFFAGLGLPGLCGFIGEVLVVLSVWNFSWLLAVIAAAVVILTAAYILWAIQRVYLGAEYHGPHEEALTPITLREGLIAGVLVFFAVLLGVMPYQSVLDYMDETVTRQVTELTEWTKNVKEVKKEPEVAASPDETESAKRDSTPAVDKVSVLAPQLSKQLVGVNRPQPRAP